MLSNDDLPPLDKPITEAQLARIGVHRRGWAGEGESIPELAAAAATKALDDAGVSAESLDFIVVANWTQRRLLPDFAPRVQQLLGAPQAFAFDVATACAGFVTALSVAEGYLQNPRFGRGLIVGAETTSRVGRPHSKATLVFGDAAGAWVVERGTHGHQLLAWELSTDGRYHDAMEIDAHGHCVTHIDQKELQKVAVHSFRTASDAVLQRAGVTLDDVDWIVPHSGTAGIQALLLRTLGITEDRVLTNFREIGNVSSAAIPASLDQYWREGRVQPGHLVLSPTTGSGWYAGAALYRMGPR
jgi:3-oxoacyl-[acyl-carrier-protein] synthase-3